MIIILISYFSIMKASIISEINLTIKGNGLQQILNEDYYLEPDNVIVNGENRNDCKKSCELTENINNITLIFNDDITTCENMFYGSKNIEKIDLSNFNTEKVTSMKYMFNGCEKLIKIDFGNIETSRVNNMEGLFSSCYALTSIDLSKFDTTNLENTQEMFYNSGNLKSLDLSNFKTTNLKNMYRMFGRCRSLLFVNFSGFDTSNVENMQELFKACYSLKYLDLQNFSASSLTNFKQVFSSCSKLIYVNLRHFKIENINNVDITDAFEYPADYTKYCIEDEETKNYLLGNKVVDCSDFCFKENVIGSLNLDDNDCYCNEFYKFEYNNICHQKCPNNLLQIQTNKTNRYICSNSAPENYYLDSEDNIYKECYSSCKRCRKPGNNSYHNCDECINNLIIYNDSEAIQNNCYKTCNDFYYFNFWEYGGNSGYTYQCSDNCYSPYDKFILPKKKCINDCKNDNEYKYEYNNSCYLKCPEYMKTYEEEKICVNFCDEELFEYNDICYNDCPNNTYRLYNNRNICVDEVTDNYYLDETDRIYKECYNLCKKCSILGDETNNQCDKCIDRYKFINDTLAIPKNCYIECDYNYFFNSNNEYECTDSNTCPQQYNKLISDKKKCIDDCQKDDEYKYEYNNNCYNQCPEGKKTFEEQKLCLDECYDEQFEYQNKCNDNCPENTYKIILNRKMCTESVPINYYRDENDDIYKSCYYRCKTCHQSGNDTIHNCDECINGFMFLNDTDSQIYNCYNICNYYYYFDDNNKYKCTQFDECPSDYNKLISPRHKCINYCKIDPDYTFEYNNSCLMQCPESLKIDVDTKHCLDNCKDDQIVFNEMCYNDFPENNSEFFKDGKIFVNNISNLDDILNNIILSAYKPEIGNNLMIQLPDEKVYQITNSKNELEFLKDKSKNTYNLSIIDLGQCESLLKKENNINENDSLIFIKSEITSKKASEKNIKFDAYNPYNKEKLNISLCEEIPVNIYFPMELSQETKKLYDKMKNIGYDMFNINDPFYQDICTPFDSPDGTDVLLTDRIDYIYYNDDTKCQPNCKYSQYSIESQYLNCSCSTNENAKIEHKKSDKFNAKKLYYSFYEVLKYSNYDIIKCYNIILNIDDIKVNKGCIIVILYFFSYLLCFFIFMFRGIIPLKIKLRNALYIEQKKYNLRFKFNIHKALNPPIKKKFNPKYYLKKYSQKKDKILIFNKNIININLDKNGKIEQKPKINSNSNSKINIVKKIPFKILYKRKIKGAADCNKKEVSKIIKRDYSDYELNELEYEEAKKLDKRSICKIYWQTLQREHLIFFTFFNCNDFNLLSVKISRCIFLIVGDMALNVFFFSDDSMHKLFLSYGKYDFIQQIPQITYSTIISQIIEIFLCFLSLTDKYIYEIKSNIINGKTSISNIQKILKCIYIRLYIFFTFILIFFGIYWYIITVFCGVYRNTQIVFIKDSFICFIISLIYPFILYFVSGCLRVCSLKSLNKSGKCIYKLSYSIPLF